MDYKKLVKEQIKGMSKIIDNYEVEPEHYWLYRWSLPIRYLFEHKPLTMALYKEIERKCNSKDSEVGFHVYDDDKSSIKTGYSPFLSQIYFTSNKLETLFECYSKVVSKEILDDFPFDWIEPDELVNWCFKYITFENGTFQEFDNLLLKYFHMTCSQFGFGDSNDGLHLYMLSKKDCWDKQVEYEVNSRCLYYPDYNSLDDYINYAKDKYSVNIKFIVPDEVPYDKAIDKSCFQEWKQYMIWEKITGTWKDVVTYVLFKHYRQFDEKKIIYK